MHCESNWVITWRASCVNTILICVETFGKTISVLVVTFSAQDTVKLLQQLKSGFERIIILYKPLIKIVYHDQNQYFHLWIQVCRE